MKKAFLLTAVIAAVCTASPQAFASGCATEGAFALALAQVMDFDADSQGEAASLLKGLGVSPAESWNLKECLTRKVVFQVDASIRMALTGDRISPAQAEGATRTALAFIVDSEEGMAKYIGGGGGIAAQETVTGTVASSTRPESGKRPKTVDGRSPRATPPTTGGPDDKPPAIDIPPDDKPPDIGSNFIP